MSNRNRFAPRTDGFYRIDLAEFPKAILQAGGQGTFRWSQNGHEIGSACYRVQADHLILSYTATTNGERQSIKDQVYFAFTKQPFGGLRKWFVCPSCLCRCRVLFGGAYFRCRQCQGATYESQYEHYRVAGLNRAQRIRKKLGGEIGISYPFPDKQKGMHWRTWLKQRDEDWATAERFERLLMTG
jgi:hypothetical protein